MTTFTFYCINCEQELEASTDMIGQKASCPGCGNVLLIPHPDGRADSSYAPPPSPLTPSAGSSPEPALKQCPYCSEMIASSAKVCRYCSRVVEKKSLAENTLFMGHPSWWLYLKRLFVVLCLGIAGFALKEPVVTGIGVLVLIWILLDRYFTQYKITSKITSIRKGIIAKTVAEVSIRDIRNINTKQSILGRIFGIGRLEIASAGTAGVEVVFVGIPNPEKVKEILRKEKDLVDEGF